ncbi:nitrogen regulatory IIA protein [Elizabethkingia anophelis]|uniref:Nitrogen regulatory IIA protein n=3 Tax=Elizabethkingia anophelis TaxID=1117645 RepID=A0A455ZF78_9FLAO|nr:hypothetical protein BD94_3195 [Elizabethkingia anophelis NUHP1]MDV3950335.1 nitrogen regulatory IIA protein [Elizabethkingia anophelis]DAC75422.1 TPA_exp: FIG01093887: hypothetical protein [Elizabethkingia anophelis]
MKKIREKIDTYMDNLDNRWKALPVGQQRRYTILLFAGYLVVMMGAVFQALYEAGITDSKITIERIKNPVPTLDKGTTKVSDTTAIISNRNLYENRK